jgi:putative phosphoesterase
MRLAIISDIHCNLVALDTVLAKIETQRVDQLLCPGDVVGLGPQPREVIARLQTIACPVVMGNNDGWILQPVLKESSQLDVQYLQDINVWSIDQLTDADKAYIKTFQPTITISLSENKTLLAYHGSPRSYHEILDSTTPDQQLEEAFQGFQADIMVGGHTHMQMFRRYKQQIILNPGSVGLAFDRAFPTTEARNVPWAEYAIVDVTTNSLNVELYRIPFDISAFIETILKSRIPHAEWLVSEWNRTL